MTTISGSEVGQWKLELQNELRILPDINSHENRNESINFAVVAGPSPNVFLCGDVGLGS
jgi:hypothetical protein